MTHLRNLPDALPITPPIARPAHITVRPPGSKSLTNRALALAALADSESTLTGAETESDDGAAMLGAIRSLGASVSQSADGALRIMGVAGKPRRAADVFARDSGTTARFIAAACALGETPVTVDGSDRLRQRPIGALFGALRAMGAAVECTGAHDSLPAQVSAYAVPLRGGAVQVQGDVSSQFISALLMVGPWCKDGLQITCASPPVSAPYITMTTQLMERVGADVHASEDNSTLAVAPGTMPGFTLAIEPDASAAMVFAAAAAILPGVTIEIAGVMRDSMQGDVRFLSVLDRMGARATWSATGVTVSCETKALAPIDVDLADIPDQAMTLAVLACFASGVTTIRGLRTLRDKECDRIAALQAELGKIGVRAETFTYEGRSGIDEALRITPTAHASDPANEQGAVALETHNDHRMAMTLALLGLRRPGVVILNPACASKTYPAFWRDFALLGALRTPA